MRNRSHPLWAVFLCLAVSFAASADDRTLVEMEPARAAREALAPIVPGPPGSLALGITNPEDEAIFTEGPTAHLWGRLEAFGIAGRVDAVVVIDTSASTARAAERRDRVRERMRGRGRHEDPPSILAHEIRSAEVLLADLDPRNTRLGIVSFAGAPDGVPPDASLAARTEVAVTGRLEALDAGLQAIARRGAAGRTDMATGLDRAVAELTGQGRSRPDAAAAKVVVFFTDGTPTLPHRRIAENEREVYEAAERANAEGVRIFAFAIGPEALRRPAAAAEMARRTSGVFTPVRRPRDLAAAVGSTVELTTIERGELLVRNATLRTNARDVHVGEGGVFGGLVPLKPGRNRIFVRVVAGELAAEAERFVHYAPGSARPFIPATFDLPPVPRLASHKELEVGPGADVAQTLELRLDRQKKQLEIHVGSGPAKGAVSPDDGPAAP